MAGEAGRRQGPSEGGAPSRRGCGSPGVRETFVIPAPREVDALMRAVPHGRLTTITHIREALASRHGTTIACPLTTGIFAGIAAKASAEAEEKGEAAYTPYWRTLKTGGEINPKYPGGCEGQKARLEAEGHRVTQRGQALLRRGPGGPPVRRLLGERSPPSRYGAKESIHALVRTAKRRATCPSGLVRRASPELPPQCGARGTSGDGRRSTARPSLAPPMLAYADVVVFGGDAGHPAAHELAELLPEDRAGAPVSSFVDEGFSPRRTAIALVPIERYAFTDESLDLAHLRALAAMLRPEFKIHRIDVETARTIAEAHVPPLSRSRTPLRLPRGFRRTRHRVLRHQGRCDRRGRASSYAICQCGDRDPGQHETCVPRPGTRDGRLGPADRTRPGVRSRRALGCRK